MERDPIYNVVSVTALSITPDNIAVFVMFRDDKDMIYPRFLTLRAFTSYCYLVASIGGLNDEQPSIDVELLYYSDPTLVNDVIVSYPKQSNRVDRA